MAGLDRVEFREPAVWRVDGDAIEAAVAVGDLGRAESLLDALRGARRAVPDPLEPGRLCPLPGLAVAAGGELDPRPRR